MTPPSTLVPGAEETPYLELLADDVDEERAREALARLQGPLIRSLGSRLGAPVFTERDIDGVKAQVVRLSPTAELTYALFESKLAAATDPAGVERAISGDGDGLSDSDLYERATDGLPDEPGAIAFLDLGRLLRLGEASGLAEDTAYATFAADLRKLAAFALTVGTEDDELRTDARLVVDG